MQQHISAFWLFLNKFLFAHSNGGTSLVCFDSLIQPFSTSRSSLLLIENLRFSTSAVKLASDHPPKTCTDFLELWNGTILYGDGTVEVTFDEQALSIAYESDRSKASAARTEWKKNVAFIAIPFRLICSGLHQRAAFTERTLWRRSRGYPVSVPA